MNGSLLSSYTQYMYLVEKFYQDVPDVTEPSHDFEFGYI